MVWAVLPTVIVCVFWGAGSNPALPAWFAATTQLPACANVTVKPATVHALLVVDGSSEKVTGRLDPPPLAATV